MEDWIKFVDDIFKINYYGVLNNNGSISHNKAIEKAEKQYQEYKIIQDRKYVSDFDELILETYQIKEGDR